MKFATRLWVILLSVQIISCQYLPDQQSRSAANSTEPATLSEAEFVEAIIDGQINIINQYLIAGKNPDARNRFGDTALIWASYRNDSDLVTRLLNAGAGVDLHGSYQKTALHWAAEAGSLPVARLLLAKGANAAATDHHGRTPLMYAAKEGHGETVQFLLAKNGDMNHQDNNGYTALHLALDNRQAAVATDLIEKGASLELASHRGDSALHFINKNNLRMDMNTPQILKRHPNIQKRLDESLETVIVNASAKPRFQTAQFEALVAKRVNDERQKAGLGDLDYDSQLATLARGHSADMVKRDYFAHYNPEGLDPTGRAQNLNMSVRRTTPDGGIRFGIGENIFSGWLYASANMEIRNGKKQVKYQWLSATELARRVVDGWMKSPGHRANILNADYLKQGIGFHVSGDLKVMVTQNFF